MRNPPLVLITGATGAVGPRVVDAFANNGYLVRTFSLDQPPKDMWPHNVEAVIGDVADEESLTKAMTGVNVVVHLAALLHIVDPPPELKIKYEHINVGGTKNLVTAAVKAGVERVVFFSTIAVYGLPDGHILDEDAPANPITFYAMTKLAAERVILSAKNSNNQNIGTVLRLGAVYGSRIKGNYERLARALANHRFIPIGRGQNRRTLVYDKDVARATLLAAEHPAAAGKIFNVSDGKFHTLDEIIKAICQSLGRRPPGFALPLGLVRPLVGMTEDIAKACSIKAPVTRSSIDKYTEDMAVAGMRIQKELGFAPRYGLSAGWAETLKEMREMGVIRS